MQYIKSRLWILEAAVVVCIILWITVQIAHTRRQADALRDISARLDAIAEQNQQALDELVALLDDSTVSLHGELEHRGVHLCPKCLAELRARPLP